jgi:hypothetical protein
MMYLRYFLLILLRVWNLYHEYYFIFYITRCLFNDAVSSWEGLIVVVTRVDGPSFEFQTSMKFPFFQHVQTGCGAHRTSYSTGIGVSFLGIKRLELETGH